MQVNCKKCGKDVTGNVNEFFEGVRKSPNCDEKNCSAKRLQEKIAKDFTLIDYMSVNTVKPVSYTHLTLPTILRV